MTIPQLIAEVIDKREGGMVFTHDAPDPPTFAGITIHTARRYYGESLTVDQLKQLSRSDVEQIYLKMFVIEPRFHLIDDADLRTVLVDFGINSGPEDAVRALQIALGFGGLDVDGRLGPKTLKAANHYANPRAAANSIAIARALYCTRLVQNDVNAFMQRFTAMKRKYPLQVREFFPTRKDELDVAAYAHGWVRRALQEITPVTGNV